MKRNKKHAARWAINARDNTLDLKIAPDAFAKMHRQIPTPPSAPADPLNPDAVPEIPEGPDSTETAILMEEDLEQVRYEIRHDLKKRVDLYLRDRLPDYSRSRLQKLIDNESVKVNDRIAKKSTVLRAGDIVDVTLPHTPPEEAQPENIPLDVVYEDDGFLAVNKQSKLIVHPARGHWTGTLINALLHHAKETAGTLSTGSDPWRPGIIHRLDRDTTGLILIAKTDEAHWRLAGQFERRTIKKTYLAIVHGNPPFDSDLIDAPLAVHPKFREKYAVREDIGRPAQTVYTVVERFDGFAIVELAPKTGRTHQLRVHMAHIGFPMVGDTMYGGRMLTLSELTGKPKDENTIPLIDRQALHAFRLQFVHPLQFHRMHLEAKPPADIVNLAQLLRKHRSLVKTPATKTELKAATKPVPAPLPVPTPRTLAKAGAKVPEKKVVKKLVRKTVKKYLKKQGKKRVAKAAKK